MKRERIDLILKAVKVCLYLEGNWISAAKVTEKLANVTPQHVRQICKRLLDEQLVERRASPNLVEFRWVGPSLTEVALVKVPPEANAKDKSVIEPATPPRTYVNGSMPNGDEAFWKAKTTWGRT
jgi:predicted Zn-dependent peptidase